MWYTFYVISFDQKTHKIHVATRYQGQSDSSIADNWGCSYSVISLLG